MATTKFTRRDLNRYKKTYPFVQRKPRYIMMSENEANIEAGEIQFDNEKSKVYKFSSTYSTTPTVTVTGYDSENSSGGNANVALMVESISTTEAVIVSSESFRGSVFIQVISVGSGTGV